ncbi:MAG: hypothetical protein ABSA27_04995 [Terriglobales bacterium]
MAKYLGEGTSRKKAEEKSSAFFILEQFSGGAMMAAFKGAEFE